MATLKYWDGENWTPVSSGGGGSTAGFTESVGVDTTSCDIGPADSTGSLTPDGPEVDGVQPYKLDLTLPRPPVVTTSESEPVGACDGDFWVDETEGVITPPIAAGGGGETCGRLTVISGDAAGQGISDTIFYTPYMGDQVPLYNGESWKYKEFSELALPLAPYASSNVTNGTLHDVFMYLDGDTPKIDLTAWNEIVDNGGNIQDQTRIDPLTSLGGILVATSDPKRRYLGTIKVDSSGQTSNTVDRRLVWNMSNRTNEVCDDQRPFASYSIGPTGWRRLGGSDFHIEFVNGISGGTYTGFLSVLTSGGAGNRYMSLATAVNGPVQPELQAARTFPNVANVQTTLATSGIMTAKVGLNVLYALEAIETNAFVNYVGTQADNRHTGGLKGAWSC
jgi:hypothetical protein